MVYAFGGRNCWCFKDWFEIKLSVNGNVKNAGAVIPGTKCLPCIFLEGPNASGKTSALKALTFLYHFCSSSFFYKSDDMIPYRSFFENTGNSEFFIDFSLDDDLDTVYFYELTIDRNHVEKERLSRKTGTNPKELVVSRKENRILKCLIEDVPKDVIYKGNASFFSILKQYGVKGVEKFFQFFSNFTTNVDFGGVYPGTPFDFNKFYYDNPAVLSRIADYLHRFDTGISDIRIDREESNGVVRYRPVFIHETGDGLKDLPLDCQSEGTVVLYQRLLDIIIRLDNGGLFCFDELDTKLHNDLVPVILKMFMDPEENPRKAQLVFTSHNSSIMDVVGKYGCYLFEKEKGESYCYRCDEIDSQLVRNDRNNLQKIYTDHVIGGYPKIEQ